MAATVSLRHFVLGMLARQPMSGYDIKRLLKSFGWLISGPSFGSLYPTLRDLLEQGLVAVEVMPSQEKPPRKIYSITAAGSQALQVWMEQPIGDSASLKAFVMRLLLAGNLSDNRLATDVQRRREQVAGYRVALEQMVRGMEEETDVGQRLALNYGLALARSELAWLDGALEQLSSATTIQEAI
ncbi:PadR family transcriptional regulator [Chloroflexota bacterium]